MSTKIYNHHILLVAIFSMMLVACGGNSKMTIGTQQNSGLSSGMTFSTLAKIPWTLLDPHDRGLQGTPMVGFSLEGSSSHSDVMRAEAQLKPLPDGKIAILYPSGQLCIWQDGKSVIAAKPLEFTPSQADRLTDFAIDAAGARYLLTHHIYDNQTGSGADRLQKFDADGKLIWTKEQAVDLKATRFKPLLRQLAWNGPELMLVEVGPATLVHRISLDSGEWMPVSTLDRDYTDLCFDGKGKLYYVSYDAGSGLRKWVQYDIAAHKILSAIGASASYQYLAFPMAANAAGDGFFHFGNVMAKLTLDDGKLHEFAPSNFLLDADGGLQMAVEEEDGLHLSAAENGKSKLAIRQSILKASEQQHGVAKWRLVAIEKERWIFRGFASVKNRFLYCDYTLATGRMADHVYPLEDQRGDCLMQAPRSWVILPNGMVVIPVLGPDALLLVALSGS